MHVPCTELRFSKPPASHARLGLTELQSGSPDLRPHGVCISSPLNVWGNPKPLSMQGAVCIPRGFAPCSATRGVFGSPSTPCDPYGENDFCKRERLLRWGKGKGRATKKEPVPQGFFPRLFYVSLYVHTS